MAKKTKDGDGTRLYEDIEFHPFDDVIEAWFWFVQAQQARNEGARVTAGVGLLPRPCEPADILKILDTLYRQRRLVRDHLFVLRHYGRRQLAPDPRRVKEIQAHRLWVEALERLEPVFLRKGIIARKKFSFSQPNSNWIDRAVIHSKHETTLNVAAYAHD